MNTPLLFPDVEVCVEVNPDDAIAETTKINNRRCESLNFHAALDVQLLLYRVEYSAGGAVYVAGWDELVMMASWLGRAYPTPQITWLGSTLDWPYTKTPKERRCGKVNNLLAHERALAGSPGRFRFYGMVADGGGFMTGCSAGIPSFTASGPTGASTFGWDFDGSYGDWYGGHEIGHTLGRYHAEFCDASGGVSYPYPNGLIGGPADHPDRYYGWDSAGPLVTVLFGPMS